MAGWGDVARQLAQKGPHRPYSDDAWRRGAVDADVERGPWCGGWDCDPVTRTRDRDIGNGLKVSEPCPECHPASAPVTPATPR